MNDKDVNKRFKEIIESENKKPKSNFIFLFTLLIVIIIVFLFIWKYYSKKINNIKSGVDIEDPISSTSKRDWL